MFTEPSPFNFTTLRVTEKPRLLIHAASFFSPGRRVSTVYKNTAVEVPLVEYMLIYYV